MKTKKKKNKNLIPILKLLSNGCKKCCKSFFDMIFLKEYSIKKI
ncbi:hypothetical protein HMPREF0216_01724 [Clostridium celatum DSM 1785]|uniref:Uncharacterized protein n=1 Tax=Clostridium celatum DSM 1785 TaxID=545697 RepID=L1QEW8_9CLOT|nr:hypothetical protein HMPREF0216_01724 [Clostridium celatum DSM 1785]